MSEGRSRFAWIYKLSADRLREELSRRGCEIEGNLSALHSRLLRCELDAPLGPTRSRPSSPRETSGHLRPATPQERPDSPSSFVADNFAVPTGLREAGDRARFASSFLEPTTARDDRRSADYTRASATEIYNILRKWNLTFSGSRGSDAEAFLVRIEEGRALIPVSDEDIFRCLPFFLSGTALHWFRARRSEWESWEEFVAAWRSRFGDPDFQFALRDEILRRTQGEHESVADYLTCMQALFDRLSPPWSLAEQLNYAHRNMLPRLQVAVRRDEIRSFASLEIMASRIEVSHEAATRYRAPPPPERSLFPELAYRSPKKTARATVAAAMGVSTPVSAGRKKAAKTSSPNTSAAGPTVVPANPAIAPVATTSGRVGNVKCWNCEKTGHIARECGEERRIYCYRCGKSNVTVKTCPTCSGNAGESR